MIGDIPKSLNTIKRECDTIQASLDNIMRDIEDFTEFEDLYVIESNIDSIARSAELMRMLARQAMDEMEDEV